MRPRIEAWPDQLSPDAAGDIARLDRILFEGDEPTQLTERWWWIIRDAKGQAVGFAGLRGCKAEANKGLAMLTRAGVIGKHRRKGLHKALIAARVRHAKREGFREVIAYVRGRNLASANALIASGFKLYEPAVRYAGEETMYFRRVL